MDSAWEIYEGESGFGFVCTFLKDYL
uniref:Uncharacterized protein n=1 Tax=Anguilla anguilla TaxID=7936 RepID=A0A0E9Q4C6_ANGAN